MSRVSISSDRLLNPLPAAHSSVIPGIVLNPPIDQLPDWMMLIPGVKMVVGRIGVVEFRRRLLHMLPGFAPCLLWVIPHQDPWGPVLVYLTLAISVLVVSYAMVRAKSFSRPGEEQWAYAVMGYILPVLATIFFLPGRSELGLMVLGILSLGDGSAALGGLSLGGRRLPWNRKKTWTGIVCFFGAATAMGSLHYWIEARPNVSFAVAFAIAGVAALAGAIVESLPIKSHDNLRVGVTAALTGFAMHVALLGW